MFENLSNENIMMFALKHYDNPQCEGEKEFHDDMKRFKYIKRLLRKYKDHGVLKERLILNHIIVLNNVFGPDACSTLLLFKIEQEHWPQVKSFLSFLGILPDKEMGDVHEDLYVSGVLRKL
tara:strand:+ start:2194 stop:2556 length:363 start_codon:yes stop_codon:yes gene_type:complete